MSHGMNKALSRHFTAVAASLGQQKSRVLLASGARPSADVSYPQCAVHDDLQLTVCAHGAAFAGTSIDVGTRALVAALGKAELTAQRVADLGCGTGVLATLIARRLPEAQVVAVDDSWAACRSTKATAESNGVANQVDVRRDHLLTSTADHSLDLVLCNPPFHRGAARDSDAAFTMFADASRALRPGGELWVVFNSHLPYLPSLRRTVGSTRIMSQTPRFVVTRSIAHG
jgi:16S rRNA (guanine1207-N2)-methyltransferase